MGLTGAGGSILTLPVLVYLADIPLRQAVGVLTGFFGVGGGFLLMPALSKFARLPLRAATGTSLAVIACNSAAGFVSHLGEAPTPWLLAVVFAAIAGVGVLVGGKVASRLPEIFLRRVFAALVLVTAGFVLWKA
jgi:uncharacterized membrane protein YfcA